MPDFVRVRDLACLDPVLRDGVQRHRAIDAVVDTHPVYLQTRALLRPACGHFAPILVDLFNDHVLARTWTDWHDQPLATFTAESYQRLAAGAYLMPPPMRRAITMMIEQDWLTSYQTLDGMAARLAQMAGRFDRRFGRTFDVDQAIKAFTQNDEAFTRAFPGLLKDVVAHVASMARPA